AWYQTQVSEQGCNIKITIIDFRNNDSFLIPTSRDAI
ncbi:hypothetical protein LINPERHAP1_LOCUS6449, partial [Linum perenne]